MSDLRALLHEAAPVPSRPLDMGAIRARSKQLGRLRVVAWLAGLGAFAGLAVPTSTLLAPASNDGRTTHVAIDQVATTVPATGIDESSTNLPDAKQGPGTRQRPPQGTAASGAAVVTTSSSAPAATTTTLPLGVDDVSQTESHRYVAHDAHFVGTAIASEASGTMLQGDLTFVPRSDHVMITIDDDVVESQTIEVSVSYRGAVQRLCVPEGAPTRIGGLQAGVQTSILIWDSTNTDECDAGGTSGVLTIVLES